MRAARRVNWVWQGYAAAIPWLQGEIIKMYFSSCLLLRYGNMIGVLHAREGVQLTPTDTLACSGLTPLA